MTPRTTLTPRQLQTRQIRHRFGLSSQRAQLIAAFAYGEGLQ